MLQNGDDDQQPYIIRVGGLEFPSYKEESGKNILGFRGSFNLFGHEIVFNFEWNLWSSEDEGAKDSSRSEGGTSTSDNNGETSF